MKKLFILMLGILIFPFVSSSTLYEFNNNGSDGGSFGIQGGTDFSQAQVFRIGTTGANESFLLDSIQIKARTTTTNQNVTIIIRELNSSGAPTGSNLTSVTKVFNQTDLDWIEFNFTTKPSLTKGGSYAIWSNVIYATDTGMTTYQNNSNSYQGGNLWDMSSATGTYVEQSGVDLLFRVYGTQGSNLEVILNSPVNNSISSSGTVNFSISSSFSNTNLTNATFYVWNSSLALINSTTITMNNTINWSSLTINNLSIGQRYYWNALLRGRNITNGLITDMESYNFTFFINPFSLTNNASNPSVWETSMQTFRANITVNPSILSVISNFYYNGSKYTAGVSSLSSSIYALNITLDAPTVDSDNIKNFFWEVISTTADSVLYANSSIITQQVNKTYLVQCNTTFGNDSVNYTIYNSLTPTTKINGSLYITYNYWLGSGTVKTNSSLQNTTMIASSFRSCVYPLNQDFHVNADIIFSATGFSQNYHYFRNATFNDTLFEQPLYLLNSSIATLTELQVVDNVQRGLSDVLIYIQYYDVGTGQYRLVGMANTNFDGEDSIYLNWYDSLYKFILVQNGTTILNVDPYKISSTPQKFVVTPENLFDLDKFKNIEYTLYFNNETKNFVLTYVDTQGQITSGCMRVQRLYDGEITVLSDQCSESTSGTLSYNIGDLNGTFSAIFYATGSFGVIDSIYVVLNTLDSIYDSLGNLDATILALIITGTAAFLGLFSPVAFVVMTIVGYTGAVALGFQSGRFIAEFIIFTSIGGLLAWYLRD